MINIGMNESRNIFNVAQISKEENIPEKFLEQILLLLKKAGFLNSKRGVGGGYLLVKPLKEIRVGQIIRLMDGPLAPITCVSQTAYGRCSCPDEKTCGLRLVMLDVRNSLSALLDNFTIADIVYSVGKKNMETITGLSFDI